MRRQLGVAIALVLLAAPALARARPAAEPAAGRSRQSELAELPPMAPLLPATEGADEGVRSGGTAIITGALLGGVAGGLIGLGLGLLQGGNYGRDIAIGAGAGLIVGGVVGATRALGDRRALPEGRLASVDRDPVLQGHTMGVSGKF